jgi:predicted Zn-dependent protease
MRGKAISRLVVLATASAVFIPLTAQEEALGFNVLSPEREAAMGTEMFEQYKREKKVVRGGAQHDMTQRVAARLTPVVKVRNTKWEFVVFEDPTPNAFALPGGKVGVHTGLFKVARNEAQLAAVLGHELGHVAARHSGKRVSNAAAGSVIGALAGKVIANKTGVDPRAAQGIAQGASTLRLLHFSRNQELEADRLGASYMARAGYDPKEAVALWRQFAAYKAQNGGPSVPGFLSTHPLDSRRIEELQAYLPTAQAEYKKPGSAAPAPVAPTSPASKPTAPAPPVEPAPPKARRPNF